MLLKSHEAVLGTSWEVKISRIVCRTDGTFATSWWLSWCFARAKQRDVGLLFELLAAFVWGSAAFGENTAVPHRFNFPHGTWLSATGSRAQWTAGASVRSRLHAHTSSFAVMFTVQLALIVTVRNPRVTAGIT